ncbi:MAG TPA: hypothetical protein VGL39_19745 [Jatrophihabitantaceae bacterium]
MLVFEAHPGHLLTENLAHYPRRGYTVTHRTDDGGFHRIHFAKTVPR